jgi:hypothetical protein
MIMNVGEMRIVQIDGAPSRFAHLTKEFWLFVVLGGAGSLGAVLTGATIGSNPRPHSYQWWLRLPEGNYAIAHVIFYSSVVVLLVAWMGIGVIARRGQFRSHRAWIVLTVWGVPLLVGTPLFGRDVYSYIAQGELARHGYNPYAIAPQELGDGTLLSSIANVWHHTTSPYGPLFVELTRVTTSLSGHSLMFNVIAFRLLMLIGVVLLMIFLPLIAEHFGVDGGIALWLGVLSPLALFSAVSSAHNDTLMLGLMVIALWLALRGNWRWAVALLAVAATIKLPALAAIVFLVAGQWRSATWRIRAGMAIQSALISAAVLIGITEAAGYGWSWLGSKALSIPTQLHILTSPTVSVGLLIATLLHAVGVDHTSRSVVTDTQHFGELLAVIAVITIVLRTRSRNVTRYLGVALLLVVILSPTVWPWYFLWGITMFAVTTAQRSLFLAALCGFAMLLVGPGGTPMIGGNGFYAASALLLTGLVWFVTSGQWRTILGGSDSVI